MSIEEEYKALIRELRAEISRHKSLSAAAADALAYATDGPKVWCNFNKLIAELRDASKCRSDSNET
jgi:hypothetical protein